MPMRKGFQFYVDDYIASQIDKTELTVLKQQLNGVIDIGRCDKVIHVIDKQTDVIVGRG